MPVCKIVNVRDIIVSCAYNYISYRTCLCCYGERVGHVEYWLLVHFNLHVTDSNLIHLYVMKIGEYSKFLLVASHVRLHHRIACFPIDLILLL